MKSVELAVLLLVLHAQGTPIFAVDLSEGPHCVPASGLQETIRTFEPWTTPCTSPECWLAKVSEAESLLEEHPDDLFVHRAYQDAVRWSRDGELREQLLVRYEERVQERPEDPAAHYLLGRVSGFEVRTSHFERSVELDPAFPWGHINLAVERSRGETEAVKGRQALDHLVEFMRLCPSRPMLTLQFVRGLGDAAFWREHLPKLRELVAAESEDRRGPAFSLLWTAEFRIFPVGEHSALRARIAEDLRRLEAFERTDDHQWWRSLKTGYELVGDTEGRKRAEAGILQATPCSRTAVKVRLERWEEAHGRLGALSSEADHRSLLSASDDWIEECPNDLMLHLSRFSTVQRLPDLSRESLLTEVDRVLGVWEKHKTSTRTARSPYYQAAALLLARDLDLERVPGLLEQEKALRAENAKHSRPPAEENAEVNRFKTTGEIDLELTLGDAQIRLAQLEAATETLSGVEPLLAVLAAESGDDKLFPALYSSRWWRLRGELSEAIGRPLDAVGFYLRAASFLPEQAPDIRGLSWVRDSVLRAELEERAHDLWETAGGSSESWQAVVLSVEREALALEAGDVVPWEEVEEDLVGFELTDIGGKTWRVSDLRGKVVLVNVWATWCGPCHAELPLIERLFEQFSERDDLMLLTLNVDQNPGIVAPFMERMGFTFPTLLAVDFIQEKEGGFSIPDNWILDASGTIRYRQSGFAAELGEVWIEETLRLMEGLVAEVAFAPQLRDHVMPQLN